MILRSLFLMIFLAVTAADSYAEDSLSLDDEAFIQAFPFEKYTVAQAGGSLFYIDDSRDCIKRQLKAGTPWESGSRQLMRQYIKPNTNVLDIGSHIGTHTVTMAQAVGEQGHVFAFEPQRKIYRELVVNLRLNSIMNVTPYHVAVGMENATVVLSEAIPQNEGARFVSSDLQEGAEKVEMRTLDSFGISNISFVKIDVENFELDVLKGGLNTFLKEKPVILIEIQGNHVQASQVSQDKIAHMKAMRRKVISYLESMGYSVSHFSCDDYLALPK